MDAPLLVLWVVRLAFLLLLYVFLFRVVRTLLRDLRAAAREPSTTLGRLVVVASPDAEPPAGHVFALDAITTLGRDVNNSIVVDDPFALWAKLLGAVLAGRAPGTIPIEGPRRFELHLNKDAARRCGLAIPRALATTATRVH